MSRRKSAGDQEFGSDSFLDIIANIVGILIILIVIAGIKVARQPSTDSSVTDEAIADVSPDESPSPELVIPDADDVPSNVKAAIEQLSEPKLPDESEIIGQQIADLKLEFDSIASETAATEAELRQLLEMIAQSSSEMGDPGDNAFTEENERLRESVLTLKNQLKSTSTATASFERTISSLDRRQTYIADALKQVAFETRRLREVIDEREAQTPETDTLNHRLSPIGRPVSEDELHFRLSGNRIAYIPLEGLLERMKTQVGARQSVVMRFHRYEGMVGPVGGFNLQYTVQREMLAPLQALQYGNSAFRISIARWTVLPADTLAAEPVETALKLGSRFRQIIEGAEPDTTITIWLYPSDFGKFGKLRELAHALNLRVAARPLPDGTPIAGSPSGSRSSSQ